MCFLGLSLTTYLEAAHLEGRAPFNPKELIQPADIPNMDPNKLLIVTTGSQVRNLLLEEHAIPLHSFDCHAS